MDNESSTATRDSNLAIPTTKRMSITAKSGSRIKTVTFPIPQEFEAWMCEIRDKAQIEVEGGNAVSIRLEIFNYKEKF